MKTKERTTKFRDFDLSVKSDDIRDDGTFTGYASVFDVVDSYRERVARGAFLDSLAAMAQKGRVLPMLWQHRNAEPVGLYTSVGEDDRGLKVDGQILIGKGIPRADEAYALVKAGIVRGLSIGYYVAKDGQTYDKDLNVTTLTRLELVEASLVTFPANDDARVDTIKAKLARGHIPTIREFEQTLRELGFSKAQAVIVANRGIKHLHRGEPGNDDDGGNAEIAAALRGFSFP